MRAKLFSMTGRKIGETNVLDKIDPKVLVWKGIAYTILPHGDPDEYWEVVTWTVPADNVVLV